MEVALKLEYRNGATTEGELKFHMKMDKAITASSFCPPLNHNTKFALGKKRGWSLKKLSKMCDTSQDFLCVS